MIARQRTPHDKRRRATRRDARKGWVASAVSSPRHAPRGSGFPSNTLFSTSCNSSNARGKNRSRASARAARALSARSAFGRRRIHRAAATHAARSRCVSRKPKRLHDEGHSAVQKKFTGHLLKGDAIKC
eukprot:30891-Pelagococcus_subviridis.AAC.7